jgi:predicted nucleic acid-binding protein
VTDAGLLDTSTVILLPRLRDPAALPDRPMISAITLAELSVGPLVAATDAERAARLAHLQQAEADFDALPSTTTPPERSVRWRLPSAVRAARLPPAPTTR